MSYIIGMDVSEVTTDRQWLLGSVGQTSDGNIYKYVVYDAATAALAGVAGEVCYYVAATGYAENAVTSDNSDSDAVGAGVIQATMADASYGWVQIKGPATLTIALATATDGAPLTATGAADGTLDIVGAVTEVAVGVSGDASAKEIICDFPW